MSVRARLKRLEKAAGRRPAGRCAACADPGGQEVFVVAPVLVIGEAVEPDVGPQLPPEFCPACGRQLRYTAAPPRVIDLATGAMVDVATPDPTGV